MSAPIPLGQIRWLVDRLHVGMTDTEVTTEMSRRMTASEWTESRKNEVINYAIQYHNENKKLYRDVVRGTLNHND